MCGILIIYSKKKKLNKKECFISLNLLHRRGPDKKLYNFFLNQKLFIGNSILNITGKIKKGADLYRNKNIYISYNGEIYNYENLKKKFPDLNNLNNTDTEILANLHSKMNSNKVPKYINGMFAYAAYDKKNKKIFFATDPQGEKRLFKYEDNNYLIISSKTETIKKFLNRKMQLNMQAFNTYFKTRHFLYLNKSIYKNIFYLNPGEFNTFDILQNNFQSKKFDDPISWINKERYFYYKKLGLNKSSNLLRKKLIQTLKLMCPKTNFGTIFSGGVDTTLISYFLKDFKNNKFFICLNNEGKDPVADKIYNFKNYFNFKKFKKINVNLKKYFFSLKKTYNYFNSPFVSHDLVGRLKIFNFFKKIKLEFVLQVMEQMKYLEVTSRTKN